MLAPDTNPDVRPSAWYELGDIQSLVLTAFTTAGSWVGGLLDWRGFLVVLMPLTGKALWSIMRSKSYKPTP